MLREGEAGRDAGLCASGNGSLSSRQWADESPLSAFVLETEGQTRAEIPPSDCNPFLKVMTPPLLSSPRASTDM